MVEVPLEIDCAAVSKKLQMGESFLFIDCRERDEYARVHIAGGQLLPMSELAERVGEIEDHKGSDVVVYCHHGGRSLRVTRWLREQGFTAVQSMAGGSTAGRSKSSPGWNATSAFHPPHPPQALAGSRVATGLPWRSVTGLTERTLPHLTLVPLGCGEVGLSIRRHPAER